MPRKQAWKYASAFALGIVSLLAAQRVVQASLLCDQRFDLLNAAAVCDGAAREITEWDYEPLRQKLVETVQAHTQSDVPDIAVYFRDLKNGPRFAIREEEVFDPVSLLKLPIMMVILHYADRHPDLMDERLTYEKDDGKDFFLGDAEDSLKLNASYTVRELLERMIKNSDNSSSYLLLEKINELGMRENSNTFADLGTMDMLMSGRLNNTRLISLVNIFVALYNANYVSPESSQYALELLSQTTFKDGIVAGVPEGVRVAHKFGIRFGKNDEIGMRYQAAENSELHDCGIVYHPASPYVLCVLTSGADTKAAASAIRDISRLVYENVDSLR